MADISVRARIDADLEWLGAVLDRRSAEVRAADPRVPPTALPSDGLVALDGAGRPVGHAALTSQELRDDSEMAVWWPARSVDWGLFWAESPAAALALAEEARRRYPPERWTASITAPAADLATADLARVVGLAPNSVYACRSGPLPARPPVADIVIRPAEAGDVATIVALLDEDLAFHAAHCPYVRPLPAAEAALRRRIDRPDVHLLVASTGDGEVVGFTESWIETAGAGHMVLPGRYGFVNTAAVADAWRGRGVGGALMASTTAVLDAPHFLLWYSVDNPLSSRIWPHLGFSPLWTAYLPATRRAARSSDPSP